jgi:predicted acetyltransferase
MSIEQEMKTIHDMQLTNLIPNPWFETYKGDGVTIITVSSRKYMVAYSVPKDKNEACYIRNIYVPEKYRRNGVALNVINKVIDMFVKDGNGIFEAEVEESAEPFFKRLNFVRVPNMENNRMRLEVKIRRFNYNKTK